MPVNLRYIIYSILKTWTWTWIKVSHVLLIWWVQFLNSSNIRKLLHSPLKTVIALWRPIVSNIDNSKKAYYVAQKYRIEIRNTITMLVHSLSLHWWWCTFYNMYSDDFICAYGKMDDPGINLFRLVLHKLKEFQSYNKLVLWAPGPRVAYFRLGFPIVSVFILSSQN